MHVFKKVLVLPRSLIFKNTEKLMGIWWGEGSGKLEPQSKFEMEWNNNFIAGFKVHFGSDLEHIS